MFDIHSSKKIYHANQIKKIFNEQIVNSFPYIVRTTKNNGIRGYIIEDETYTNDGNTLTFAQDTFSVFYQREKFFTGNKIKVLKAKFGNKSERILQYITASFQKSLNTFTWGTGSTVETISQTKIQLPTQNGKIDFAFMDHFITELEVAHTAEIEADHITELESYLAVTNLKDDTLTMEEDQVLKDFQNGMLKFDEFTYNSIFNKIAQGRRLKKEDQVSGSIPFVMAGTTNTGIVNYISNPVACFPKNSITIDIFGNTFYRDYDFGAGDDTGIYWNDEMNYSKESMLFFATLMKKSLVGKFDFSKKLRSSQSINFKIKLPTKNNQPNHQIMETFIRVIQKLVIKDLVLNADKKIKTTNKVISNKNERETTNKSF